MATVLSAALLMSISISSLAPAQGDTVVIAFSDQNLIPDSVFFDGKSTALFPYRGLFRAVFGISAVKLPGNYPLKINFRDGQTLEKIITVRRKRFAKIEIEIPEKLGLTPKALVQKLNTVQKDVKATVETPAPEIYFDRPFGLPLADNRGVGSPFGEIRKTGGEEIRHLGLDLEAPIGKAVGAINSGVVRKAYFDSIYGNSVILDHGQGIFSLYLHLNKIKVKEGEKIKQGQLIGTVGQTGFATSPHLHLSVKIGGVSVDPIKFVAKFK